MPIDHYPSSSEVREVGPRDGLQNEDPIPVGARIDLVDALSDTGLRAIEVGSFVRADAIPAMAGTDRVLAAITRREGVRYRVLVPNLRAARTWRSTRVPTSSRWSSASAAPTTPATSR